MPDDVLLVMDEAYIEFLDDPVDLVPMIRRGAEPNLILMRTFSKIYGLAGLRMGYGIGAPGLDRRVGKDPPAVQHQLRSPRPARWPRSTTPSTSSKTRQNNARGLKFFARGVPRAGPRIHSSAANFILVRVGEGQHVFEALQKQGVIVRPMGGYQLPEWIRISIGTPRKTNGAWRVENGFGQMFHRNNC